MRVPEDGVPRAGVVKEGLVAKTRAPLPVSSVTAVARFAEEGVPRKVATPAASPLTPVEIGRPVPLVRVTDDGVPRAGVTSVGDVESTIEPVPVTVFASVTPPYVRVPFEPPALDAPMMTLPPTEKSCAGLVVPIPTLPEEFITMDWESPAPPVQKL